MRRNSSFSIGRSAQPRRPRGAEGSDRVVIEHLETQHAVAGPIAIRRFPSWMRVGTVVAEAPRLRVAASERCVLFDVRGAVEVRGENATYYIVASDAVQTELTATAGVWPRGALQ